MSSPESPTIPWSARLIISTTFPPKTLIGDKILLPQSALEQLLSATAQIPVHLDPNNPWEKPPPERENLLPHPLIVRLTNRGTKATAYAVPREFSADEGEVVVSAFLQKVLGVEGGADLDIEAASLPKGTKIRLRPLEAGYDDEDWKPILERYMREGFATVAEGMVLQVPRGLGKSQAWRFLVDQALPGGAVCVVDTDLEVDIEPLDEDQARETLKQRLQKKSAGGKLVVERTVAGDVAPGCSHFYELDAWDRSATLEIRLDGIDLEDGEDVDLFVITDRQHHKPQPEEHVWGDMGSTYPKRIQVSPSNIELIGAKTLHIGVRGWEDPQGSDAAESTPRRYTLLVAQTDVSPSPNMPDPETAPGPDYLRCKNCMQWIPSRTLFLHENFCSRNNFHCTSCNSVFKRGTELNHWHCSLCNGAHGNSQSSYRKHLDTTHTSHACLRCAYHSSSLPDLASHRVSVCPAKLILCSFCHLLVPQEGDPAHPDAEQILSGLTRHELSCGARTTKCTICNRPTRLRDLGVHLKNHDLERLSKPLPSLCANPLCCGSPGQNPLRLCDFCFGPLYTSAHDPTGSQLQSRVERRLLRQLLTGCRRSWCKSTLCKTGRGGEELMGMENALPLVKARKEGELPFCVDEVSARQMELAERLAVETALDSGGKGAYLRQCCVYAAGQYGNEERARKWLEREGIRMGER